MKKTAGEGGPGRMKSAFSRFVLFDSALKTFKNADEAQQKLVLDVALRTWLLAKLNPGKARQAKEFLTGGGEASVQDRLEELKHLHEQALITDQEYEAKKADIIDQL